MIRLVYRGTGLSLVFHAPAPDAPGHSACHGARISLRLGDPVEVRLAVKAQAMCRRPACQERIPPGLRAER